MGDSSAEENHAAAYDIGAGYTGSYACKKGTYEPFQNE
jgi:hypothetical protein